MNPIEQLQQSKREQAGKYPSSYQQGYLSALNDIVKAIGSCEKCHHTFISGRNLRCRFSMYSNDPRGYCDHFTKRQKEQR